MKYVPDRDDKPLKFLSRPNHIGNIKTNLGALLKGVLSCAVV